MSKKIYSSVAVLMGGIIGVGIFGVPFVFSKAGILTGILFLAGLGIINVIVNLAYGEVILRTNQAHQLVGYAGIYLGDFAKKFSFFAFVLSIYAALLAYIIVGGEFLANVFSLYFSLSPVGASAVFFIIGSLAVAGGIKTVVKLDTATMAFLLVGIGLIVFWGIGQVQLNNFDFWNKEFWFLPYGVILFALAGMSSVVLSREVLDGQESLLKKSIIWGSAIPAVVYLVFALLVVGVSGDATSPEAFSGLLPFLGSKIIFLGSLFGVLAIFTSFINLGRILTESFRYDFNLNWFVSGILALLPPFLIFLWGVRNFINAIGLAGALGLGLQWIIFILIYNKVKILGHRIPEYSLNLPGWFWYLIISIFAFGAVMTVVGY